MKNRFKAGTVRTVLFAALVALSFSCGDDDDDNKVNCNGLEEEFLDNYQDFFTAWDEGDCEAMESLSNEIIDTLNKGKNCQTLKDAVEDEGYDSVDEFIDELEEEFDIAMADC